MNPTGPSRKLRQRTGFADEAANGIRCPSSNGTETPDKKIVVKVDVYVKKRSLQQLRYYRGVMLPQAQKAWADAGYRYSLDQIDQLMKAEFLYSEIVNKKTGEVHKASWSMADGGGVTAFEFAQKWEEIYQWYSENLSYSIPAPNEQLEIK